MIKTPQQITQSTLAIARAKVALPAGRLLTLSILAGAYIALGGALSVMAGFGFPSLADGNPSLQRLLSGATFPIGLILVVVLGAELFTGNNAVLMPACVKGHCRAYDIARNWTLVWTGNFIGALLFSLLLVVGTGLMDQPPYRDAITGIATTKSSLPWLTVLLRGIGANWCVCLAVWLALASDSLIGKMAACWVPVMAFVALGYEHSVANMFFIPTGIMLGADVSVATMMLNNILPATIGNIIGGALFVGCIYGKLHPVDN